MRKDFQKTNMKLGNKECVNSSETITNFDSEAKESQTIT